jgi:hypothetical protein
VTFVERVDVEGESGQFGMALVTWTEVGKTWRHLSLSWQGAVSTGPYRHVSTQILRIGPISITKELASSGYQAPEPRCYARPVPVLRVSAHPYQLQDLKAEYHGTVGPILQRQNERKSTIILIDINRINWNYHIFYSN